MAKPRKRKPSDLNDRIRAAEKTAHDKMAKIKREQRYDIANSKNNPVNRGDLSRMSPQARSGYLRRLNRFNATEKTYLVGANNQLLSPVLWAKYKRAEKMANEFVQRDQARYRNIPLMRPASGTVGDWLDLRRPRYGILGHVNPGGIAMHEMDRRPGNITSEESLRRLIKAQQSKSRPGYWNQKKRKAREQFREMMDIVGDDDLKALGDALSDDEFMMLWNYTEFPSLVALDYLMYQKGLEAEAPGYTNQIMKTTTKRIKDFIEWAAESGPLIEFR